MALVVGVPVVLLALLLAFVKFRYEGYTSPTAAMAPTLEVDERFLVEDVDGEDVDRGEVVVFRSPGDTGPIEAVSRVLGLPGEELAVTEAGVLTVDEREVDEPHLADDESTDNLDPVTVPEGTVFLLSDNRTDSRDSRAFGPVPFDDVVGRVAWIWWPLGRAGGV